MQMKSKVKKPAPKPIPPVEGGDSTRIVGRKLKIPAFKYRPAKAKEPTQFQAREIEIPEKPGAIIRTYLDRDGIITTQDASTHELILNEIQLPDDEFEPVDPEDPEKGMKKKKLDLQKAKIREFKIPQREGGK